MRYNFKVDLNVYSLFLNEYDKLDVDYIKELENKYDEFRIRYNTEYDSSDKLALFNVFEGNSDQHQILLVGIKDGAETTLCYWLVGDEEDEGYKEGIEAFEKIKKFEIK
jgi:uncharacterized protein YeaO (DUF488 family)